MKQNMLGSGIGAHRIKFCILSSFQNDRTHAKSTPYLSHDILPIFSGQDECISVNYIGCKCK